MHNDTMRTTFFLTILILLLATLPSLGKADSVRMPATTSSKDLVITSDSGAYCQQLEQALSEKMRLPHGVPVGVMEDAHILQKRGKILCEHHHVRAGIERLRRALLLLKKHEGPLP